MKISNKKILIQYTISIAILFIIFMNFNLKKIETANFYFNVEWFFYITLTMIITFALRAWRWQYLMNNETQMVSFISSFKIFLVGNSLNMVMPGGIGDIAKSYFGYAWSGIKERMITVSLFDKMIGVASLFFISFFSYYYQRDSEILIAGFLCLFPLIIIAFGKKLFEQKNIYKLIFKINSRILKQVSFDDLISNLNFSFLKISVSLIMSIIAWFFTYALLYLSFDSLNLNISFMQVMVYAPVLALIRMFPFTLNGIGTDEAAIIYFFSKYEPNKECILIGSIIYRFVLMIIPALLGAIVLIITKKLK